MTSNKTYLQGLSVFILLLITGLFNSCKKETVVKTVVETKTDTVVVVNHDTVTVVNHDTVRITDYIKDAATTFILTRHAETTGVGSDPALSTAGDQRAADLAAMLGKTKIYAAYATSYNRTKQTAAGIAANNALTVQIYDPLMQDAFVTSVLANYSTKVVYIAGHSNTIPALLNILTGSTTYTTLPDTEYDNLYIVNVFEKGRANVVHLKY